MKYELAKALEDARFPFGDSLQGQYVNEDNSTFVYGQIPPDTGRNLKIPTLSELIEACGDILLFKIPDGNEWRSSETGVWVADSVGRYLCADTYFIDTTLTNYVTGATPEEAVARLWLALNTKI